MISALIESCLLYLSFARFGLQCYIPFLVPIINRTKFLYCGGITKNQQKQRALLPLIIHMKDSTLEELPMLLEQPFRTALSLWYYLCSRHCFNRLCMFWRKRVLEGKLVSNTKIAPARYDRLAPRRLSGWNIKQKCDWPMREWG